MLFGTCNDTDKLDYKLILQIFTEKNLEKLQRQHEEEAQTGRRRKFIPELEWNYWLYKSDLFEKYITILSLKVYKGKWYLNDQFLKALVRWPSDSTSDRPVISE